MMSFYFIDDDKNICKHFETNYKLNEDLEYVAAVLIMQLKHWKIFLQLNRIL